MFYLEPSFISSIQSSTLSQFGHLYALTFMQVQLASVIDIACMKIAAISQRGTKKDFVDLYVLLQRFTSDEILKAFEKNIKAQIIKDFTF